MARLTLFLTAFLAYIAGVFAIDPLPESQWPKPAKAVIQSCAG